ncbi:hypothetical protein ACE2AJ_04330 [Aquihabitans daechungensis]|uniref:hypothetical protein n=1 Tax=Aquihabitans daechungensis TaxID=1052257 RepID=UPI003B9EF75A
MTTPTDQVHPAPDASDAPDTASTADAPDAPGAEAASSSGVDRPVHRLRDLGGRGRWAAAGIALLLVLVPLIAAMANHGRWEPQGDDALIELRARDVGTARNPLVGQPSTSGSYGERAKNVAHPGPLGFVVLAPTTRVLGPVTGTLLAAAAVSAVSMLAVAWLLFRQLGPRGGAAGAALVALAAFSAGAAGLTDPLSSNFGRMPLLAAAVGVWALFCGDLRVAPLTVAFWSFAAQQHLSVLPAAAVLAAAGVLAAAWWVWRAPSGTRRRALAWVGGAVVVGVVLWGPVIYQQLTGDPGNLTALADYSGDAQREDLGRRSALSQVANVLGPRPFLGRSSPKGWDLVAHRSTAGVLLTFVLVGAVLVAGSWWRRKEPKFLAAVAMIGVLGVAAVVTGMNIPDSPEQGRLNFYHWAFALSFFELLVFGWLIARLAPVVTPKLTHGRPATAVAAAGIVVLAVAVTPLVVDRPSDRLGQPLAAPVVKELIDEVRASGAVDDVDGPVLVLVNGDDRYIQVGDTLGTRLAIEGAPIVFPSYSEGFVHPDRIADPCSVRHALVVSLIRNEVVDPPGTELASVDGAPTLDREALARLVEQAGSEPVELGPDLDAALAELPADQGPLVGSTILFRLHDRAEEVLLVRSNLDLLIDHPTKAPKLDRDDLIALRDSLPDGQATVVATEVKAHLLDRAELEEFRPDLTAGC